MDGSSLFSLPAEVRIHIYNHLLDGSPYIRLCGNSREHEGTRKDPYWEDENAGEEPPKVRIIAHELPLGALAACRQLRDEILERLQGVRLFACHRVIKAFPRQLLAADLRARITEVFDEHCWGTKRSLQHHGIQTPCWCQYSEVAVMFPALRSMSACMAFESWCSPSRVGPVLDMKNGLWGCRLAGATVPEHRYWFYPSQGTGFSLYIGICAECGQGQLNEDGGKKERRLWPSKFKVFVRQGESWNVEGSDRATTEGNVEFMVSKMTP
jgi:hypothetical protein